jgi:hypothetical protein
MPKHILRLALLALGAIAVSVNPAQAGPPWIAVEYPANPHHSSTRGATFLVHTFHHGDHITPSITASFEGLVDGRRQTRQARVAATHRAGVYAVRGDVPSDGTWLAVVRMRAGTAPATAVVTLGSDAQVLAIDVPTDRSRDGWYIPRDASEADITAALRSARIAREGGARSTGYASAALVLMMVVGVAVRRW